MIVKQGEWDYWFPLLSKAFGANVADATSITFEDKLAWITPSEQGPAKFVLNKDGKPVRATGVTAGPRFRQTKATITFRDAAGAVLYTNAPRPKKKARAE